MKFKTIITEAGDSIALETFFKKGKIKFERVELGNEIHQDPRNASGLENKKLTGQLISVERPQGKNTALIKFSFDNRNVVDDFKFTEYGLYASYTDENNNTAECLYAYGFTDYDNAATIPKFEGSETYVKENITISIGVGAPEEVSVYLGEYEDYASKEVFEKHLGDYENPHRVTATQLGAASKRHNHSATDITTGKLPVERGGTGSGDLNDFLEKLTKNMTNNINIPINKGISSKNSMGAEIPICGTYDSGQPYLGSCDESTHVHGSDICIKTGPDVNGKYHYILINSVGTFYPKDANTQYLGSSSRPFKSIYVGNMISTSDRKAKENITDCEIGLKLIQKLTFKEFNFKGQSQKNVGLIAQEVFDVFQSLGISNSKAYLCSVKGNDANVHPEYEDLTDEQIKSFNDEDLIWSLDYQMITNYIMAGLKYYISDTDERLKRLEKLIDKEVSE